MKNSTSEPGLKDKLTENDRATIEDACKSALEWLETASGSETDAEQYEAEQKKLEGVVTPIVSKLYGGPAESSHSSPGPNIEEVD